MPAKRKFPPKKPAPDSGFKWGNALSVASKALMVANQVSRLMNVEMKKATVQETTDSLSTTANSMGTLTSIVQGDGKEARDGNSILIKSIQLRYFAYGHASARVTAIRILLVRDLQQVADTVPSMSDVLEQDNCTSYLNPDTVGRFKILYDKVHVLNDNSSQQVYKEIYLPCSYHVRYNGTAAADIQKGGIYLYGVSTEATNTATVKWSARLTYVDN